MLDLKLRIWLKFFKTPSNFESRSVFRASLQQCKSFSSFILLSFWSPLSEMAGGLLALRFDVPADPDESSERVWDGSEGSSSEDESYDCDYPEGLSGFSWTWAADGRCFGLSVPNIMSSSLLTISLNVEFCIITSKEPSFSISYPLTRFGSFRCIKNWPSSVIFTKYGESSSTSSSWPSSES